ncbi:MAG TPA: D-cysteine desulfhydrase family protein [Calditrichaeota bacterium]|nr:D-cysteine desulfhydrase family protein [Calditrichota bacterium]
MKYPDHLHISQVPTPIINPHHFFSQFSLYKFWIKRDDLNGLELSGNKLRKLEFLLQDAYDQGAEHIITCGGMQSNHCRTTAFLAAQAALKTTLVLRGKETEYPTGNYFLNRLAGAEIYFVNEEEYKNVDMVMAQIAETAIEKCYIIPEGGSNETGVWGYIKCYEEIMQQSKSTGQYFDTIVVATGSGGTHAGLLLGKILTGGTTEVLSVNVCNDALYFQNKISDIIDKFASKYEKKLSWSADDIHIVDGFTGEGYGKIGNREKRLIRDFARQEGLLIDPVYGAKAMLGLLHLAEKGRLPGRNILFIHTGGVFGLFPYASMLLA